MSERLDRIEATLERLAEVQMQSRQDMDERFAQITEVQEQSRQEMDRFQLRFREDLNGLLQITTRIANAVDRLSGRVDSLAAASEQHDRILGYLLRREQDRNGGAEQ